mmetsp:Transcript_62215/g.148434  ORF Transcript_62215/g.148434 Transcript_62215/m.148434 type:complete len:262 (+) Transcript_62215:61-846(+)
MRSPGRQCLQRERVCVVLAALVVCLVNSASTGFTAAAGQEMRATRAIAGTWPGHAGQQSPQRRTGCRAVGFSAASQAKAKAKESQKKEADDGPKFRRRRVSDAQLQKDHGMLWKDVRDVLYNGKPAKNPEVVVRARFSAVKVGDVVFMARSAKPTQELVEEGESEEVYWAKVLALPGYENALEATEARRAFRNVRRLEILGTRSVKTGSIDMKEVDFRMYCMDDESKVYREPAKFQKDPKLGWIYSNIGSAEFEDAADVEQ